MANKKNVTLKLPPALLCYCNLFQARAAKAGDKPKFSVALLWPKSERTTTLKPLYDAIKEVAIAKFGAKAPEMLKQGILRSPIRDGDERYAKAKLEEKEAGYTAYRGMVYLNANANADRPPTIAKPVAGKVEKVCEETEAYSGCKGTALVGVFAYETKGNKGIGIGLNGVLITEKGPRLGGVDAEAAFMEVASQFGDVKDTAGEEKLAATGTDDMSEFE